MEFHEPPVAGSESQTVIGVLERTRSVMAWKCSGLEAAAMQVRLGPSALTLGGLLKHMAFVEDFTFKVKFAGLPLGEPWRQADFDADPDFDFTSAARDSPEDLFALWTAAVERSRATLAAALAEGDLGQSVAIADQSGTHANLRRLLLDLIDEYARHNGHADLIRESIDGLVGEDPPSQSG